ncbi:hypothetical protein BHQ19_30660 [Mycolicibacterium porcinum]|nr:hypothetical protein BHQ19_30660 [Mycolicibacterium porcinum]
MATKWPKPAEGSWTEHYPDLGTGPIPFRDSISAEFYAQEREAIFKRAWLNISRVEETPDTGSTASPRTLFAIVSDGSRWSDWARPLIPYSAWAQPGQ